MTPDDRKNAAEQILANPLMAEIMAGLEHNAVELCVNAKLTDNETRAFAAMQVRAIRAFRAECEGLLRNNLPRKGAPA